MDEHSLHVFVEETVLREGKVYLRTFVPLPFVVQLLVSQLFGCCSQEHVFQGELLLSSLCLKMLLGKTEVVQEMIDEQ